MKLIAILLLALTGNVLGETLQELESLPQALYTKRALAELEAISTQRFLSEVQAPTCEIFKEDLAVECSIKFKWMKIPRMVGVRLAFILKRLQIYIGLLWDYEAIFEHKIDLAKFCVPLPGLLKEIKICLHAYYVDIDTRPPGLSFDACFLITLGPFLHLRLNCIHMDKQRRFSHHHKFEPEESGIIVLSIEDGNLKFTLNNPIPKEVWEQIERGWKDFEQKTKQAFDKAGKELDKFGKDTKQAFDKFGKDTTQAFDKFGKDTKQTFDKVGQDLDKFGKDTKNAFDKFGQDAKQGFEKFGQDTKKVFDDIGQKFTNFFG